MKPDMKKLILSNLPYLMFVYLFGKVGQAYRLAAGNDFAHKLIGLGQTIGPAFADFAADTDWKIRRTGTGILIIAEANLYDPVFQRMKGDDSQPSTRFQ